MTPSSTRGRCVKIFSAWMPGSLLMPESRLRSSGTFNPIVRVFKVSLILFNTGRRSKRSADRLSRLVNLSSSIARLIGQTPVLVGPVVRRRLR
jgi:uncharacterized protein YjeT (DUF2065 family)